MKKMLFTLIFVFTVLLFNSCDDSLPEVSTEDGNKAIWGALTALYLGFDVYEGTPHEGVTAEGNLITYIAADLVTFSQLNDFDQPYTTVSGTIEIDETTELLIYDLKLVGGPVSVLYIEMKYLTNEVYILELNGHDMKAKVDLTLLADHLDI